MDAATARELTRLRSENARLHKILADAKIKVPASPDDEKFLRALIGCGLDVKALAAKLKIKDHSVRSRIDRLRRPFVLTFVRVEGLWRHKYRVPLRAQKKWLEAVSADPVIAELVYQSFGSRTDLSYIRKEFWERTPGGFKAAHDEARQSHRAERFTAVQASRNALGEWRRKEAEAFSKSENLSPHRRKFLQAAMASGYGFSMQKTLAWFDGTTNEYVYFGYEIEQAFDNYAPGLARLGVPEALDLLDAGLTCVEDVASTPLERLDVILRGNKKRLARIAKWVQAEGLTLMERAKQRKTGAEAPA